jgi:hypothetical protein
MITEGECLEVKIFKKSLYYHSIEEAHSANEKIIIRDQDDKFDLDTDEG